MGSRSKKGASQPKAPPPRLAVLGAGGVGKSSMVLRYLEDRFSEEYIPTIEAVYSTTIEYENQQIGVELLDTAGTESFMAMRNLYIAHSCGFLLGMRACVLARGYRDATDALARSRTHARSVFDR